MLAVAAEIVAAEGIHATSMDDVAAACGVTKPMIYSYFGSKQGLIAALVERTGTIMMAGLMAMAHVPDPAERFRRTVTLLVGQLYEQKANWQVILAAMRGEGPATDQARGYRAALIQITTITLAGLAPPGVAEVIARRVVSPYAYAIMGAAESGSEWWLRTPGVTREEATATALKVVDAIIDLSRRDLAAV
ncbi:TetR family transcriptional regulator [Zavarzinia compransoris]|nr:TetR family transcriptional regulator [Zavarzinia compransoris]